MVLIPSDKLVFHPPSCSVYIRFLPVNGYKDHVALVGQPFDEIEAFRQPLFPLMPSLDDPGRVYGVLEESGRVPVFGLAVDEYRFPS